MQIVLGPARVWGLKYDCVYDPLIRETHPFCTVWDGCGMGLSGCVG